MRAGGLIVTGTDTGVGKTVVAALLASCMLRRGFDVGVMKPLSSGCNDADGKLVSPDALFLREKLGLDDPLELINPIRYREPLAPAMAARLEGREVDLELLQSAYESLRERHELLLVEGIGGLLVPLKDDFTFLDLARRWNLPVIVVARPGLGTINHTALTVRCARSDGLRVVGFVFNACEPLKGDSAEQTNPSCVENFCGVPFWGTIPYAGESIGEDEVWSRLCDEADKILASGITTFLKDTVLQPGFARRDIPKL